ncbi:deoxyhypusine synthase family protein [Candidatus Neomarinimicrobiota bacterium]
MQKPTFIGSEVRAVNVLPNRSLKDLLSTMAKTGFQGRGLAEVYEVMKEMMKDDEVTVLLGFAGSLSVVGQWEIICWMIENGMIDILVSTGANISEDIVEAIGLSYYQITESIDDASIFRNGYNRYLDVCCKETDYLRMTELIAEFILTLEDKEIYTSREFLRLFGVWLDKKNIHCIVSSAAKHDVPIYCPAIADSPFGDAAILAKKDGYNLRIDGIEDYTEFISLTPNVRETGVIYIGGGVPKDFIQLFAVTGSLQYDERKIPGRTGSSREVPVDEMYYPHKYAVQITTDSPQWGGLSGCTFEEATSWGKESSTSSFVQCYCDATIALPIIAHALCDDLELPRKRSWIEE